MAPMPTDTIDHLRDELTRKGMALARAQVKMDQMRDLLEWIMQWEAVTPGTEIRIREVLG